MKNYYIIILKKKYEFILNIFGIQTYEISIFKIKVMFKKI